MWIILTIVFIIIIISIFASVKNNIIVRATNLENGGMRMSYEIFTKHLIDFHNMNFDGDTGREFYFSKKIKSSNKTGKLIIGIKLNIKDEPILFTKFKNEQNSIYNGKDVAGIDFNKLDSIQRCINISMEKIQEQGIIFTNSQNKINNVNKEIERPNETKYEDITKEQFEKTLTLLINEENPNSGTIVMMLRGYIDRFPEEKERLEKIKTKWQKILEKELYGDNDGYFYYRKFSLPLVPVPNGRIEKWDIKKIDCFDLDQKEELEANNWEKFDLDEKIYNCCVCDGYFDFISIKWLQDGWFEEEYREGYSSAPYDYYCEKCIVGIKNTL